MEAIQPRGTGGPSAPGRRAAGRSLAIISAATAVIHFSVSGEHFHEYWLYGAFMLTVAWLQLLWAARIFAGPPRWLLYCGVILNGGVVAVYVITRTVGDVVGPAPHTAEPVSFTDVACTGLEALVLAGCAWLLVVRGDFSLPRRRLRVLQGAAAAATAGLMSAALAVAGPSMGMTANAGPSAMHMSATSLHLATATPAGDITMPGPGMQMAPGMAMADSAPCDAVPTKGQQQAAVSLVNATWRDTRKFQSLAAAKAAGYRPVTPSGLPVVHYMNVSYYLAALMGGPVLNTAEPQSLVYANTPNGAVLAAAMYMARPHGPTPQPGGCLTQWHVHTNLCLAGARGVVGIVNAAHPACPPGSKNRVTGPMMHVWFVPVPGGPTAIDASDAQVVQAAAQVASPANGAA